MFLRQSTSQDIRFGPFVDSTDGVTAETALTIAQADMQLSKDGAAFAQKNTTGNATHDADGWYVTTLDTTDTGTVGELYMQVNVSGALPVWVRYWVIEETIYDSLYGASAGGYLAPTTAGRTLDVTTTGEAGIDLANVNIADGPLAYLGIVDNGTAQSVTATTLVTRAANPDGSIQAGMTLMAYGSTQGYWQSVIIDSVTTDTLTIAAWPIATPSGTITYYVQGTPTGSPNLVADVNVLQISGDATAADNCEAFFDGTGYAGTNNVIPTVTTLTGHTAQTGDTYALANGANGFANIKTDTAAILVDTGTTLDTKLNDIQGATFSSATDSLEAIRDRGDAAWTTGAGGSDRLLMIDTTIATLATQTSFTLTAGSADDDAYNNCTIVVEDVSTSTQKAVGMVLDYTGSTKTVTLKEALAFTIATTDKVYILAENALKSTVANRQLDVTATGAAGIDWANIENPTTAVDLSGTDIQLCDTVTTNTDMRGTDSAATAASLATAQADLDIITGADGVNLLSATQASIDAIETDTNSLNDTKIPQTLNLTASGNIGIDWANVENPTTALDLSATDIQLCDTITTYTGNTVQTGDSFARLGAPAGASVSADVAAVKAETASILTDTGTTLPALIDDLAVKKNATFSNFEFLMVLTSDHATPATGLTVTGQRSIDGAAFASVDGTIAEVSNGIYQFDALAADTNGDVITWRFSAATADDTFVTFKTVA